MTYVEPTLNTIPTEPIGSIPRPLDLLQKLAKLDSEDPALAVALACERGRRRVLKIIRKDLQANQTVFVGVITRIHPRIEAPEEARDSVLEASEYIPIDQLGITDDCGFALFSDGNSISRDAAFAKVRARVHGTELAAKRLGGHS